jgi:hypothetical protein
MAVSNARKKTSIKTGNQRTDSTVADPSLDFKNRQIRFWSTEIITRPSVKHTTTPSFYAIRLPELRQSYVFISQQLIIRPGDLDSK